MFSELDTTLTLLGLIIFLAGIYLWLGLAAVCILFGLLLMVAGWRLDLSSFKGKE